MLFYYFKDVVLLNDEVFHAVAHFYSRMGRDRISRITTRDQQKVSAVKKDWKGEENYKKLHINKAT